MNSDLCIRPAKVAIVGAGFVGSTAAYAMMLDGTISDIALIDVKEAKAQGEALDLQHGMPFTHVNSIVAGDSFELVADAQIVVVAAGIAQKPGQSRTDLLATNVAVFSQIIPQIVKHNKECILLVVTNPLDILTYVAWKLSGFPSCRVLGTGTILDTARLRYLLGDYLKVSPKDISAFMLGEHGDTEFAWWSRAGIAGIPVNSFPQLDAKYRNSTLEQVRNAAAKVIALKGASYYAIALVVAEIIQAIILDQSRVYTVSSVLQNYDGVTDVCLSVPTVVRKSGICTHLKVELDETERQAFGVCVETVASGIAQAEKLIR